MKKKLVVIISCVVLMLTTPCCSTVLASNILKSSYQGIINKSFDTLSYTDEEYKMFAKKSISDYDRIQSTIIGYLATEKSLCEKF